MTLSLVVLAAGLGRRFGGTKQLEAITDDGATFLDFAIEDAIAAGVENVVLVVRSEIDADVRAHVAAHHPGLDATFVRQDEFGPARRKPWGTGHAVLAAATAVDGPFLACNADDYYGASTYPALTRAMRGLPSGRAHMAGFPLGPTTPAQGAVSRAVCTIERGQLVSLVETHGLEWSGDIIVSTDPPGEHSPDTLVSMNLWGFHRSFMDRLSDSFDAFHRSHPDPDGTDELYLPGVVGEAVAAGALAVGVVPTAEPWIGITNRGDLEVARERIRVLR